MSSLLHFRSGNTAIRMFAEEFNPGVSSPDDKRPAILLLHGAGGHVDFWTSRLTPFLREGRMALYAPHYFDRTQTGRADLSMITDGVHVPQWMETLDAALHFVASRPSVDPAKIVVAGISLGAFLALSFAAQLSSQNTLPQGQRIRALIDISGGLPPPYSGLATSKMPPTLILHGGADNIVPVSFASDLDQILSRLNVHHRTEILPGEGHWFSAAALPRILFAVSNFLSDSLR